MILFDARTGSLDFTGGGWCVPWRKGIIIIRIVWFNNPIKYGVQNGADDNPPDTHTHTHTHTRTHTEREREKRTLTTAWSDGNLSVGNGLTSSNVASQPPPVLSRPTPL